jgi:tetratricopeptide (TPR) repeat protein
MTLASVNGGGNRTALSFGATLSAALMGLLLAGWPQPAAAVTQLERGQAAPEISLATAEGKTITSADFKGQIVVLVFGELYHAKSRDACRQLDAVLKDQRLTGQKIWPVLIVSQRGGTTQPPDETATGPTPATILQDAKREAFGAYRVAALPSVVVLDAQGKVVYAMAGLIPQFADVLRGALMFAAGQLSAEGLEQVLHPQAATQPSEQEVRSGRLAQLARQLARRGMDDLAADKYAEAIQLNPADSVARVGLGQLLLGQHRLAEAEVQFRAVLSAQPESVDGNLGVAFVQTLRGGKELPDAEKIVHTVLARNPSQPRAHYLLGLIQQKRGQNEEAAVSFRKAAELYMEHSEE